MKSHITYLLEQMGVGVTTGFDRGNPTATGSISEIRVICDKNNVCHFVKVR